ncbi:MAG: holo-ACP synthase [Erysipelotrichaceae bacterium]|nr:holo-ACP synthase [Erysipelotrichaceae bacterium]MBR5755599.1 holo-ACP synthase [Erysipelotrichaceae bacterium]
MKAIGIDIIENERIRKSLKESFLKKVLSQQELEYSKDFSENRMVEFVAGRFACKEAIIKCISEYEIPELNQLDIFNDEKGKPHIRYKDYRLLISISHEKNYSVATALLDE